MGKIKFGVVGVGVPSGDPGWKANLHWQIPSIAWSRYFPKITSIPEAELVSVCARSEESVRRVQSVYKVRQTFTDYDKMLEETNIDAVIIASPNKLHANMAIKAIKAGKHVLIEKPMATNLDDAKKILEEANKAKVKVFPLPWVYSKFYLKVKKIIEMDEIGKIAVVRSRYSHSGPGHAEWFYKAEEGGGVIFDLGIYPVSALTGLFGSAKSVQAFANTVQKQRIVRDKLIDVEVEDNAILDLNFENNILASIETNYCTVSNIGNSYEFHGTEGSIFLENRDTELRIFSKKKCYDDLIGWITFKDLSRAITPWPLADPIVEYFIESILKDWNTIPFIQHQVHVIEILEKSKISAKNGKIMKLETYFNPSDILFELEKFKKNL
ncbi:MAG: Gfo/Idh/MocA family oxidoreductase [Nitrososphaeria archaeon]